MLQNKFTTTDTMLKEYVIKIICKNLLVKGFIISTLGIIITFYHLLKYQYIQVGIFGSVTFICILVTIISPYVTYKQLKTSNLNLHNGNTPETNIIFDDKIYIREGSLSINIEYSQIKKFYKLKSCYVLIIGKSNGIIVDKNGFVNGTIDYFFTLIKQQCTNLKI